MHIVLFVVLSSVLYILDYSQLRRSAPSYVDIEIGEGSASERYNGFSRQFLRSSRLEAPGNNRSRVFAICCREPDVHWYRTSFVHSDC